MSTAFTNVRGATGAADRLYIDPVPANNEPVSNAPTGGSISAHGRYEIGSVINAQTPTLSL